MVVVVVTSDVVAAARGIFDSGDFKKYRQQ